MTRSSATPRRTARLHLAVASLAVLATLGACGGGEDGKPDGRSGSTGDPTTSATTELSLPETGAGRCMVPNVRTLRLQEVAFRGTAVDVAGGEVTLAVGQWYAGEETDQVVVQAPAKGMVELGFGTEFEEGGTYLVSATDGRVTLCGFTAEASPELEQLYEEAYGE